MNNMIAGQKRQILELYSKNEKPDEWGQPGSLIKKADLRGHVINRRGDEIARFGTELATDVITIVMNFSPLVKPDMVIKWVNRRAGERNYEIKSVNAIGDFQTELHIVAEYRDHE